MNSRETVYRRIASSCEELEILSERIASQAGADEIGIVLARRSLVLQELGRDLQCLGDGGVYTPDEQECSCRAQACLLASLAHDARIATLMRESMAGARAELDRTVRPCRAALSYASHSKMG